eukprot:621413-Amphidinium_carterae.1
MLSKEQSASGPRKLGTVHYVWASELAQHTWSFQLTLLWHANSEFVPAKVPQDREVHMIGVHDGTLVQLLAIVSKVTVDCDKGQMRGSQLFGAHQFSLPGLLRPQSLQSSFVFGFEGASYCPVITVIPQRFGFRITVLLFWSITVLLFG